jgi:hypothetical protein
MTLKALVAATCALCVTVSLSCSRRDQGNDDARMSPGGAAPAAGELMASAKPGPSAAGGAQATTTPGSCSRRGWSALSALGSACSGVCVPDSLDAIPKLEFETRDGWCSGCTFLKTPWAAGSPEAAVAGGVRAHGPGPDWVDVGMAIDGGQAGITGIYDRDLQPIAGYYVDTRQALPCGRIASLKFSAEGELGAQLMRRVGDPQWFFGASPREASKLFDASPALTWPTPVVGERAINDLWFSKSHVVMDLSGSLVIGDRATGETTSVSSLGDASGRTFSSALVVEEQVFVSSWRNGTTEWFARHEGQLRPFLGDSTQDIRALVSDGTLLIWLQGSEPKATPSGVVSYGRYDLYKSAYTDDRAKLSPALLAADVPALSHLVLANGRLVGIYMMASPVVRAGALVVDVTTGAVLRSELPGGYSWGYELYPAEAALWGAITAGPMISFETIARVPYASLTGG